MRTELHNGFQVPVLEKAYPLPKGLIVPPRKLGRYDNWERDPELVVAAEVGDRDKVRWLIDQQVQQGVKAVYSEDGFQSWTDRLGRRRRLAPVSGGDIVTYVTCPEVGVADGASTAASASIQVLPNGVSPLFAGAGGLTGGTGGFWYVGRTIQYTLMGRGTTSTTPGSTVFQANVATSQNVTTGNAIGGTSTIALAASQTNISWFLNGWATCRAVGTGGTLMGMAQLGLGVLASSNVQNMVPNTAPATGAVDTTANSAINILLTLGATTVAFTVHMMIWQVMN